MRHVLLIVSAVAMGCSFESPDQAAARCKTEGIGKLPPLSGDQALVTGAFLLDEYVSACMKEKGFQRNDKGDWSR